MAMDPNRLPGRQKIEPPTPAPIPTPAPTPTPAPEPAPVPAPAPEQTVTAPAGETFTGLDPLTRSLVEAAPLVTSSVATATTPTTPPTQRVTESPKGDRRFPLRTPAFLVALGGTFAAGLLVLTGARRQKSLGQPTAGTGTVSTIPTPMPTPVPTGSWLVVGG